MIVSSAGVLERDRYVFTGTGSVVLGTGTGAGGGAGAIPSDTGADCPRDDQYAGLLGFFWLA